MSSKPTPTLHHLTESQSIRILFALEELSLLQNQPYNLKVYNRVKGRAPPELKNLFPLGKSPILEIPPTISVADPEPRHISTSPDPNTDRTIATESRLILHYLANNYAGNLWTPTAEDEARDVYFQDFAMCTLASITERILIFDLIPQVTPLLFRPITWTIFYPFARMFKKDLEGPFTLMEDSLSESKEWFSGQKMGIADFCMMWPMDIAEQRGWFDGTKYPKITGWLKRIQGKEAYKRAVEKSGGYNLKTFGM